MNTQQLAALVKYVAFGITEGDWLNDWATHLPEWTQQLLTTIMALA